MVSTCQGSQGFEDNWFQFSEGSVIHQRNPGLGISCEEALCSSVLMLLVLLQLDYFLSERCLCLSILCPVLSEVVLHICRQSSAVFSLTCLFSVSRADPSSLPMRWSEPSASPPSPPPCFPSTYQIQASQPQSLSRFLLLSTPFLPSLFCFIWMLLFA